MDFLFSKLYLGFFFLIFSLSSWHPYSLLGSLNTVSFPLKITIMKVLFKKKKKTEIQKVLNLNLIKRDLKISPYFQEVCFCHM